MVMQAVARNPLAEPGVLGINAGASLLVVVGITFFGVTSLAGYVWFAFAGALLATVLVYGVGALGREGATPVKIALSGAAANAAFVSLTTTVLLTDTDTFERFRLWQVGSLSGRDADVLAQVAPFVIAGAVLALLSGRLLNTLVLGDDVATGHPEFAGQTVAVGAYFNEQYGAYVRGDSRADFVQSLGFTLKPEIQELASGSFYVDLSREQVELLDADLTVVFPIGADASAIKADRVLNQLPSAKAGHLVVLENQDLISAFSSGSALGTLYAIDNTLPVFADAL